MYKSVCLALVAALITVSLTPVEGKKHVAKSEAKLAARYYEYPGFSYGPYDHYGDYYNRYRPNRHKKPKRPTRPKPVVEERPSKPAPAPAPVKEAPKEEAPKKPAKIIMLNKSKDPEQEDHEDEERDEKEP